MIALADCICPGLSIVRSYLQAVGGDNSSTLFSSGEFARIDAFGVAGAAVEAFENRVASR